MKKKGFTLIELLAVILILGIIALIAIPTITKILEESRRGAFNSTLNEINKAIENQCTIEKIKNLETNKTYVISNGKIFPSVDIKGSLPDGEINVDDDCGVTFNLYDNNYMGIKNTPNGKIEILKKNKENTLLINIIKNNNEIINNPITKPGIEYSKNNEANLVKGIDDDGITYYFRGNVLNNYVKLGVHPQDIYMKNLSGRIKYYDTYCDDCTKISKGSPMIFRIIRINGDGTIRLILEESLTNLNYSDTSINSKEYTGYSYNRDTVEKNSLVKDYVDNWYSLVKNENPNLDKLIANGKFCSDNTTPKFASNAAVVDFGAWERNLPSSSKTNWSNDSINTNVNPTFKCNVNNDLNFGGLYILKVGLLTLDEASFSGLKYFINNSSTSTTAYLDNGDHNWTMSPITRDVYSQVVGTFSNKVQFNNILANSAVRPVINLNADVVIKSGNGSKNNPYYIER